MNQNCVCVCEFKRRKSDMVNDIIRTTLPLLWSTLARTHRETQTHNVTGSLIPLVNCIVFKSFYYALFIYDNFASAFLWASIQHFLSSGAKVTERKWAKNWEYISNTFVTTNVLTNKPNKLEWNGDKTNKQQQRRRRWPQQQQVTTWWIEVWMNGYSYIKL